MLRGIWMWFWLKLYMHIIGAWKAFEEKIWERHRTPRDLPQGDDGVGRRPQRTIVITGGNRGIGWNVVKQLLPLGYHLVIGVRKPESLEPILQRMKSEGKTGAGSWDLLQLDLKSMKSVEEFAENVKALNRPVHVLINNAGIMFVPKGLTEDGFETHMAVNHLGHFLLSQKLLPLLKKSGEESDLKSRIVNVSSCAHYTGSWIDFDDISYQNSSVYSADGAYGNSKVAQIMTTYYQARQLLEDNAGVTVNAVHPGVVNTNLYENTRYMKIMIFVMKSPKEGADSVIHAAISSEIEGQSGLYFENSRARISSDFSRDEENQRKMWNLSMKMLKL